MRCEADGLRARGRRRRGVEWYFHRQGLGVQGALVPCVNTFEVLTDGLCGQVSAEGLDPHVTPVSAIMTRSPMVTRDTTSATEALELMVSKHFRHLVRFPNICIPIEARSLTLIC